MRWGDKRVKEWQRKVIRKLYKESELTAAEIAEQCGVCERTVYRCAGGHKRQGPKSREKIERDLQIILKMRPLASWAEVAAATGRTKQGAIKLAQDYRKRMPEMKSAFFKPGVAWWVARGIPHPARRYF